MKKIFLAVIAISAVLVACNKGSSTATTNGEQKSSESCEFAYVKIDSLMFESELYKNEGKALEEKLESAQKSWEKREQGLQYEYNQLQEKYQKGLITTADANAQGQSLQKRMENYQASSQREATAMQEENFVIQNRFQEALTSAIKEINADGKYKMIFNSTALLDGSPALDITGEIIVIVNRIYAEEKKNADKEKEKK